MDDNRQTTMDEGNQTCCPVCGATIPTDAKTCPHCKETLWADEVPEELGGGSATETAGGTPPPMLGEIHNRDFRPEPDMEPEAEAEQPRKVRGWLMLFCVIMFMSVIRTAVDLVHGPTSMPRFAFQGIAFIGMKFQGITMAVLTIYALIRINYGKNNAVFLCKALLLITLASSTCMMLICAQFMGRTPVPVISAVVQIVMCILWLGYFNSSAQVERLFPTQERNHSALDVIIVAVTAFLTLYAVYSFNNMVNRII